MEIKLICSDNIVPHPDIEVSRLPCVLGRAAEADVQLRDSFASRFHCQLQPKSDVLVIRDLQSENGTFVNGKRINEAELMSGDHVSLGASTFKVHYSRRALKRVLINHNVSRGSLTGERIKPPVDCVQQQSPN